MTPVWHILKPANRRAAYPFGDGMARPGPSYRTRTATRLRIRTIRLRRMRPELLIVKNLLFSHDYAR
jgi:hypothetical protein